MRQRENEGEDGGEVPLGREIFTEARSLFCIVQKLRDGRGGFSQQEEGKDEDDTEADNVTTSIREHLKIEMNCINCLRKTASPLIMRSYVCLKEATNPQSFPGVFPTLCPN